LDPAVGTALRGLTDEDWPTPKTNWRRLTHSYLRDWLKMTHSRNVVDWLACTVFPFLTLPAKMETLAFQLLVARQPTLAYLLLVTMQRDNTEWWAYPWNYSTTVT
jgi:hypothetical protein